MFFSFTKGSLGITTIVTLSLTIAMFLYFVLAEVYYTFIYDPNFLRTTTLNNKTYTRSVNIQSGQMSNDMSFTYNNNNNHSREHFSKSKTADNFFSRKQPQPMNMSLDLAGSRESHSNRTYMNTDNQLMFN